MVSDDSTSRVMAILGGVSQRDWRAMKIQRWDVDGDDCAHTLASESLDENLHDGRKLECRWKSMDRKTEDVSFIE